MKMNKHYNELKASYLFVDIAHKVAAYQEAHPEKEIIRLGIGDVTQPLAKCVVDAMHDAVTEMGTKEGFHGYGPEQGYPFLKQAIQGYYAGRGTKLDEDEIFISDGAKSDLANVLGLFDVDNTVLVPDPVYPTYVDDNVTDGRKIIYGRTSQENGFLGMPDDSVKADIIYICSPNNPTGAAYTRDQLKAWVEYARKNNAIILYDAAYECFISDGELARSIFEIEGARECAIEICSFSKIAGFTGTRCGYTVVPKDLERDGMNINKLWLRRQTTKFNGVPYVVQRGAAAVFTECSIPIQHNLMTRSGSMEGVTRVYSHPQSLGQCVQWLNRNVPSLERLTAESNGEAARLASENPTYAAVAGEVAAKIFGLQIVAANIQDSSTNRTRFLILGREPAEPSANPREDKTSLIFSVPHRAGSLYQALKPFDDFGVSMMRLDSRPAKRGTWEYFFYTDIEGNMSEPKIREALEIFREGCASLKCLGSYPTEKNFRRSDTKGSNL